MFSNKGEFMSIDMKTRSLFVPKTQGDYSITDKVNSTSIQ